MAVTYVYSDFDNSLTTQRDGDIQKDVDVEAIKNSLINILQTTKGTRRMLPEFGCNLEGFLFEPLDSITARKIGGSIVDEILTWENRMVLDNVNVFADEDNYQYNITISYHLAELGDSGMGQISFILKQS